MVVEEYSFAIEENFYKIVSDLNSEFNKFHDKTIQFKSKII